MVRSAFPFWCSIDPLHKLLPRGSWLVASLLALWIVADRSAHSKSSLIALRLLQQKLWAAMLVDARSQEPGAKQKQKQTAPQKGNDQ
jgi:hypothetical protein